MEVRTGKVKLEGELFMPEAPVGVILRCVAPGSLGNASDAVLAEAFGRYSMAMLRVSLLTGEELAVEPQTHRYQRDAEFLAGRVIDVAQWVHANAATAGLPIGYCGYYATAAAVLVAATQRPDIVSAVVAINGRTDLANDYLRDLRTPTLLTINEMPVLRMNREALSLLKGERRIEIVHGDREAAVSIMVEKSVRWFADRMTLVAA
ncbi:MAG: hydrolase [Thermoanaerobaculia bacterium]|nr:hydrolase [Thermoanaerobaculia bacterium]